MVVVLDEIGEDGGGKRRLKWGKDDCVDDEIDEGQDYGRLLDYENLFWSETMYSFQQIESLTKTINHL